MLLVISGIVFADDSSAETVAALSEERIPHLKLEKSTLKESLLTLEKIWQERHPDIPFPLAVVDFERTDEYHTSAEAEITFELKNVSYNVALTYIAELSGYQLSDKRDQKVCGMIVRNEKSQLNKIAGILLLLEEGYSIQKPVHKDKGE